jgi:hypothetical protein
MRVMQDGEHALTRWYILGQDIRMKKAEEGKTAFELKLPILYREYLARLLALERYSNLIETNIVAGITLYTDHKPGLIV